MKTKLILIEGLPGSGKSTTAEFISSKLTEMNISHRLYLEDPDSAPIEFLWPESPTFRSDLESQWLKLVESMKHREDLVLLESIYWQWTTWFIILLNYPHDDVIVINSSLHDIITPLAPLLIYFAHTDVESHIQWIYNLRGEEWSNFMIQRDLQLPYHQSRDHKNLDGLITCFRETQSQYDELYKLTRFQTIKIQDPHENWPGTYQKAIEFIRGRL